MNNLNRFFFDRKNKSAHLPFYAWFGMPGSAALSDDFLERQFQKNVLNHVQDNKIVDIKRSNKPNYEDWQWKDIAGCEYIDQLKSRSPHLSHIFIFMDYRCVVSRLLQRDFDPIDQENMSKSFFAGLVWKYFRRKQALQKLYMLNAASYLKIWLRYNEELLKDIKKLPRDSYVLLDQKQISTDDARMSAYFLKMWNLSLRYFKFKSIDDSISIGTDFDMDLLNSILLKKIITTEKHNSEFSFL